MGLTLTPAGRSAQLVSKTSTTEATRLPLGKDAAKLLAQASRSDSLAVREKAAEISTHIHEHLEDRTMSATERSAFTNFVVKALMSSDIGAVDRRDIVTVAEAYVENLLRQRPALDEVALRRKYCDATPAT